MPSLVLEAIDGGSEDGTVVSINKPSGIAHQKWHIFAKEAGFFAFTPAHAPSLVLTVAQGGTKNGTAIVLEKDSGQPSQVWSLVKHENGSCSLIRKHAPEIGLDHFGGKPAPGVQVDLWTCKADDCHLQWRCVHVLAAVSRRLWLPMPGRSMPRR